MIGKDIKKLHLLMHIHKYFFFDLEHLNIHYRADIQFT